MLGKLSIVLVVIVCICSVARGQSIINPFTYELPSTGSEFTYSGSFTIQGGETSWSTRSIWTPDEGGIRRKETYDTTDNQFTLFQIDYYRDGKLSNYSLIRTDGGFTEIIVTDSPNLPETIQLNQAVSERSHEEIYFFEDGIPDSYVDQTRTYTAKGIDIIELEFGRIPAVHLQVSVHYIAIYNPDYYDLPPIEDFYSYDEWYAPGLGIVRSNYTNAEARETENHKLSSINFDFDPEPIPIADSDNAVWNTLGYTWDRSNGWQESFEFGSLWTGNWPVIYSADLLSWFYVTGDRHNLWAWDYIRARWIYTTQAVWPFYFDTVNQQWTSWY